MSVGTAIMRCVHEAANVPGIHGDCVGQPICTKKVVRKTGALSIADELPDVNLTKQPY
jgi:hypothetical protein